MSLIRNPILPGFHPDPSILRVEEDFFVATSTFEWFPGVLIYLSRDLVHWRLAARPLARRSLLDMRGLEASNGVWAPCLTHDGEYFYLVYSNVLGKTGPYWDVHNYVTRAPAIDGPWSEPVYANRSGFDPSLFHDDDGRKWFLNMIQDPRPGKNRFAGIVLQEFDWQAGGLVGEARVIFRGTDLGCTEGPHIYKRGGFYYLVTAEGGTSWPHAVSVARSRSLFGPYEVDPENPCLTAWKEAGSVLQKAGHGSFVEAPDGSWYLAHLCARPLGEERRCILGRETALQRMDWPEGGWPRLASGGRAPQVEVAAPDLPPAPFPPEADTLHFDQPELPPVLQTLREPFEAPWGSLHERPGWLRLRGRMSLCCAYEQSLVGRRIQHFNTTAETLLDFSPDHYLQTAGLAAYYDDQDWLYLAIGHDEEKGRVLRLLVNKAHRLSEPLPPQPLPAGEIRLQARLRAPDLRFAWATADNDDWSELPITLDASALSDEAGARWRFTGAFFVICAQNHTLADRPADFRYLAYRPLPSVS
jgi:xylan 1,4-beta-xylosidase